MRNQISKSKKQNDKSKFKYKIIIAFAKGIDNIEDLVSAIKQSVKEKEITKGVIEYQK